MSEKTRCANPFPKFSAYYRYKRDFLEARVRSILLNINKAKIDNHPNTKSSIIKIDYVLPTHKASESYIVIDKIKRARGFVSQLILKYILQNIYDKDKIQWHFAVGFFRLWQKWVGFSIITRGTTWIINDKCLTLKE